MANVTFNIPNNWVPRILNAIAQSGFERKQDEPDVDYFKRYTKEHFVNLVYAVERAEASSGIRPDYTIMS